MLDWKREVALRQEQQPARRGPHVITVAASTLIAIQLIWMGALLSRAYFAQDDFGYLDRALTHGLSWSYLMMVDAGHLLPVGFGIVWVLARMSLYNWPLTCASVLLLMGLGGLALLRLLRALFGNRPAILIPLAVYLFSPLTLAPVDWWSVALEVLPLELATFLAMTAHIRYLRTGRLRSAVAAAAWMLLGMASMDKGAVVPLLLFALTAAFFVPGRLPAAAVAAARQYWRAWALYGGVLAVYCIIFFTRLPAYTPTNGAPITAGRVFSFVSTLIASTLVPGAMGGPWRWAALGTDGYVYPVPPAPLEQLAWGVVLVVVILSCLYRARAWRAWAILAGYLAAADVFPVVLGRLAVLSPGVVGMQQRYVTDAVPVLALCLGLAFLPLAGEDASEGLRVPARTLGEPALRRLRAGAAVVIALFVAGSFWSLQSLESVTNTASARSYIATARVALTASPRQLMIIDQPTPPFIMNAIFFHPNGYTSYVLGAMVRGDPARHLLWVQSPTGVIRNASIFDLEGRLWPAAVGGVSSGPPPARKTVSKVKRGGKTVTVVRSVASSCWDLTAGGIPLPHALFAWGWTVRLDYSGPATTVQVGLGGKPAIAVLPAGTHSFYVPVQGSGKEVSVATVGPSPSLCVTGVTVGTWRPASSGQPVPAMPVPG